MSANIRNIINIILNQGGTLAQADNVNVVCLVTSDGSGPIGVNDRTRSYTDLASLATDFGTLGAVYEHGTTFFGTSPNSVNAGGRLVVGYWEKNGDPGDPATIGALTGGTIADTGALITSLQSISDGEFQISIEGNALNLAVLNFTSIVDLDDANTIISSALDGALSGASSFWSGTEFVILTPNSGVTATIQFATNGSQGGTYIGTILSIDAGSGATLSQGQDATQGTAETAVEALVAIKASTQVVGVTFIDAQDTDQEILDLASYAQANNTMIYDTFSNPANLETNPGNPVWDIKLAEQKNYRMQFSAANNRNLSTSYMARMHSVNFNAENSAITMHLKTLNLVPEQYSQNDIDKAKNVGLDIYTTTKNTPEILSSGANGFTDDVYNLIAYVGDIEVDAYNVLKGTSTKVAQTIRGVNKILDQLEKTTEKYVRAGVIAPGEWTSPDNFGDLDTFNRSIRNNGYYFLAGSLSSQSQVDREARKSPVFQGAIKAAGAIHSADIIINFNK